MRVVPAFVNGEAFLSRTSKTPIRALFTS
jgi:hypothetical protein